MKSILGKYLCGLYFKLIYRNFIGVKADLTLSQKSSKETIILNSCKDRMRKILNLQWKESKTGNWSKWLYHMSKVVFLFLFSFIPTPFVEFLCDFSKNSWPFQLILLRSFANYMFLLDVQMTFPEMSKTKLFTFIFHRLRSCLMPNFISCFRSQRLFSWKQANVAWFILLFRREQTSLHRFFESFHKGEDGEN